MKITLKALIAAGLATVAAAAGAVYFGVINVGADDPHSAPVYAILSIARDRSIEVRSRNIQVPDLSQEALIREGAGNYNSMCVGCHLAPGLAGTELSNSLYPAPPNLRTFRNWASMGTQPQLFGSSSTASNPPACPRGAKAWPIPTYGGWSHFSSNFRHWMQSNTRL